MTSAVRIVDWSTISPIGDRQAGFDAGLRAGKPSQARSSVTAEANSDRLSALALATAEDLFDSPSHVPPEVAASTAVVLGTSTGSIPKLVEMAYDSHTGRRGHDVRPMSIPSMVPNAAAGRIAIEYGLTGPSTTVAAGELSGFQAVTVAARFLRLGHATHVVAGAVEELSAERMMADRVLRSRQERISAPATEACGLAVLMRSNEPVGPEFLGARYGYSIGSDDDRLNLLTRLIRSLLQRHGVRPGAVVRVYLSQPSSSPRQAVERAAVESALGGAEFDELAIADLTGHTASATGSLQLSAALTQGDDLSLLTALGPNGETAAVMLRHP